MCQAWVLSALRDPDSCFVKDNIDAIHDLAQPRGIANVPFDKGHLSRSHCRREVLLAASSEIIQHHNLLEAASD